jgi:hypothetical protein
MVHALEEIRRVLQPAGTLIDLRPLAGRWPVDVVSRRETRRGGQVSDLQQGLEDDAAANRAMAKAAEDRWFVREREQFFPLHYYWDSPKEMQEYVEEQWADFIEIDEPVWLKLRSVWSTADADARIRVQARMLITRWKNAV